MKKTKKKKRKKKKVPRNPFLLPAKLRKSGAMKHKNEPKKGSKKDDFLDEWN